MVYSGAQQPERKDKDEFSGILLEKNAWDARDFLFVMNRLQIGQLYKGAFFSATEIYYTAQYGKNAKNKNKKAQINQPRALNKLCRKTRVFVCGTRKVYLKQLVHVFPTLFVLDKSVDKLSNAVFSVNDNFIMWVML